MSDKNNDSLFTQAVHAGLEPDPQTGAVAPAIHPSATFARDAAGELRDGFEYTRSDNPTRRRLEAAVTALHPGAWDAAAFASGSAAAAAVLRTLQPGSRLLVPRDMYHGLRRLLETEASYWSIDVERIAMHDPSAVREALRQPAAMVWTETPSNPNLHVTDLAEVSRLAHAAGATVAVDATWTPPGVTNPFHHGADLVVHSSTKYFGGHSDLLGGVVVTAEGGRERFERVRFLQRLEGAVPSPFDAWLTLRGIRTLALRVERACDNAAHLARALEAHSGVHAVHYPGLASHPQHAVAGRQMDRFGAMLSFQVHGGPDVARQVPLSSRLFTAATSLGGVESLIEHRAPVEGPGTPTPNDLLRVSVGIEDADDLIADLTAAVDDALKKHGG
jgi:cystathionine gamma-synthase